LHVLQGHSAEVRALVFSPTGDRLASSGGDARIQLWRPETGQLLADSDADGRPGLAVLPGPGGDRLASLGQGTLHVWEVTTGKPVFPHEQARRLECLAASRDGHWLAVGGFDPPLRWWDTAANQPLPPPNGIRGPVAALAFSPSGDQLAVAGPGDGTVWLWNRSTGEPVLLIPAAADGCTIESLVFHPGGEWLACGGIDYLSTRGSDGAVCLWDLESRRCRLMLDGGVTQLAVHPSGRWLAAASLVGSVYVWDLTVEQMIFDLDGLLDGVQAVIFSPDGNWLIAVAGDPTLHIWNVLSGRPFAPIDLETPGVALAFSSDGQSLFVGHGNGTCSEFALADLLEE
jgi:WD40 repeat protein